MTDFTAFNRALSHVLDGIWTREQAAQLVGMSTEAYSDVYGTLIDAMREAEMKDTGQSAEDVLQGWLASRGDA